MEAPFNQLKRQYFDWRTWNYRYRNMKRKHEKYVNKKNKKLSSTPLIPYVNKPGIAFSFDDSFRIKDWYKYGKDLLGFYDVKATFNINAFHHYEGGREHTQDEIDMLLDLQANGHEIAHHGFRHKSAVDYLNKFSLEKWIEDEVESLFLWMEKQSHSNTGEKFKKPVSFAFPHFQYNDEIIKAIAPTYFRIVRGHLQGGNLIPFSHTGYAPSICIDSHHLKNPNNIRRVLEFVKKSGNNLILTSHSILTDVVEWEESGWPMKEHERRWWTPLKTLQYIINVAKKLDLEFYTAAEIAGVASFIDRNLENHVRFILSKDVTQSIMISELGSIKKLDLREKGISNLNGIQYFQNLEEIDIRNNPVSNFNLLERFPMLNVIK